VLALSQPVRLYLAIVGKRTLIQETFATGERPITELDCVTVEDIGSRRVIVDGHDRVRAPSLLGEEVM